MTAERMQIQLNRTVTRRLKAVAASIEASPMSVVMTALNGHLDMMERKAMIDRALYPVHVSDGAEPSIIDCRQPHDK